MENLAESARLVEDLHSTNDELRTERLQLQSRIHNLKLNGLHEYLYGSGLARDKELLDRQSSSLLVDPGYAGGIFMLPCETYALYAAKASFSMGIPFLFGGFFLGTGDGVRRLATYCQTCLTFPRLLWGNKTTFHLHGYLPRPGMTLEE